MNAVILRRAQKSRRLSLPSSRWSVRLATCMGMGHLPHIVGNHLGSFSVSLITPFLMWPLMLQPNGPLWVLAVAALATFIGWLALEDVEKNGIAADHDSSAVVIDEFVGSALVTAIAAPVVWQLWSPFGGHDVLLDHAIVLLYLGLMFRLFDIAKPWPASAVDVHWHHPFAVIADDAVAGLMAAIAAPVPFWIIHHLS